MIGKILASVSTTFGVHRSNHRFQRLPWSDSEFSVAALSGWTVTKRSRFHIVRVSSTLFQRSSRQNGFDMVLSGGDQLATVLLEHGHNRSMANSDPHGQLDGLTSRINHRKSRRSDASPVADMHEQAHTSFQGSRNSVISTP